MTRAEFGTETQRWYSGAARLDDLTPERLAVLWEQYGLLPLNVWRNAVSKALLEPRWPSSERMDALVGKAEDYEEARVTKERNLEAQRAMRGGAGYTGLVSSQRPSDAYSKACQRIALAVLAQGLTPRQTADLVEMESNDQGSMHGEDVREWYAALMAAGDDWRRFNTRGALVRSETRAPKLELGG